MANTGALPPARDQQLARGWDVQAHGLFGAPELTVVIGEPRPLDPGPGPRAVGLGRDQSPDSADDQGRTGADLCLRTTCRDRSSSALRPVRSIRVRSIHSPPSCTGRRRARPGCTWTGRSVSGRGPIPPDAVTAGLDGADSWAGDAHKWLNVPYDCGICLVRRPEDLRRTFVAAAGYLPGHRIRGLSSHPPGVTAGSPGRGMGRLAHPGRGGVADLVRRDCHTPRRWPPACPAPVWRC